jgi:hypothetical protein
MCQAFGEKIEDDAGYLKSGHEFSLEEFEKTLQARLDG